ncbi:hypothetical protein Tco_0810466, partial [Tanacetum coccineum]
VKNINGEAQLHARVDGKKIITTEASMRRDLQLADENGIDCLPNATIFEQLTLMGLKNTAWNEFSSTMASSIIYLAKNQKFNFSKLIFESIMKNSDNVSGKFLMYPRFVQVFLDQQLDDMSIHKRIYVAPTHTKKVSANMRKGEGLAMPTDPQHTPTITQPSTSQPKKTQKPRKPKRNTEVPQPSGSTDYVADEAIYKELNDSLVRAATTASSLEAEQDSGNIIKTRSKTTSNEAGSHGTTSGDNKPRSDEIVRNTKGMMNLYQYNKEVLDLDNIKTHQAQEITSLKLRVKKLEKKGGSRTHKLKRLYKVGRSARVISSDEASLGVLDDEEVFIGQDMAEKEINLAEKKSGIKGKNYLAQSIPDDHVADFHYMKMQEFSEVEGLHKGYDRMQKILSQLNQLKAKPEDKDINLKFLRALPSSWSQEVGKKEEDSKALITVDTLVDWTDHDGQSDGVIASKEFGMIDGCDTEDAIEECAAKIYNLITGANTKEVSTAGDAREFSLMGVTSEGRYGNDLMFDTSDLAGEEVFVVEQGVPDSKKDDVVSTAGVATTVSVAATTVLLTLEEITLAQALEELKTPKPKVKGIVFKEPVESTTTTISLQQPSQANIQDKGNWKMAKIKADHELAQRLQAQEQEELSDAEKATLFVQLLEKRRKHFAAKRLEEKRNKPQTQAQQRKIMFTYLKNMEGNKPKDLKNKSFDSIQKMFDRAFKRVNTFVDSRTDLVKGSSKRAGEELEQESAKK